MGRNPESCLRVSFFSFVGMAGFPRIICLHINSYGRFEADLDKPIDFNPLAA